MVTFVLRFWRETSAGELRWRGQIEHVQSGRRTDFLEIQDLLGFLERFGIGPAGPAADGGMVSEPGAVERPTVQRPVYPVTQSDRSKGKE